MRQKYVGKCWKFIAFLLPLLDVTFIPEGIFVWLLSLCLSRRLSRKKQNQELSLCNSVKQVHQDILTKQGTM